MWRLAGGDVKLDLYQGLPHVLQVLLANTPESQLALYKMNDFLKARMPRALPHNNHHSLGRKKK